MKCDEFTTPIKIEIPGIGTIESKDLLLKVEVDEAIAELKAENERLKSDIVDLRDNRKSSIAIIGKLNADNKSALKAVSHWHDDYCELQKVVDGLRTKLECKEDKIRILNRALWLARANGAKTTERLFDILWKFAAREKVGVTGCCHKISYAKTLKEPKFFFSKFLDVERKCRAKAEEFK